MDSVGDRVSYMYWMKYLPNSLAGKLLYYSLLPHFRPNNVKEVL